MRRLIRIYTVYQSVFDFELKPLFARMEMSKSKDGRVHFRNTGVKGLKRNVDIYISLLNKALYC